MLKIVFIVLLAIASTMAQETTEVVTETMHIVCGPDSTGSRDKRCTGPPPELTTTTGDPTRIFCGPDSTGSRNRRCLPPYEFTTMTVEPTFIVCGPDSSGSRNRRCTGPPIEPTPIHNKCHKI